MEDTNKHMMRRPVMLAIPVDREVHHQFKVLAAKLGLPVRVLIVQFIEKMLESEENNGK